MAPIGIPQGIRVVLENIDVSGKAFFPETLFRRGQTGFENPLTGLFVYHQLEYVVTLRRRILGMTPGVLIKPSPVREERVGRPTVRDQPFENVAQDFFNGQIHAAIGRKRESVFTFQSENPFHEFMLP